MPDVIVNKNGVFIDTHVRYRTISDNLSKQEYKFLLTTTLTISGITAEYGVSKASISKWCSEFSKECQSSPEAKEDYDNMKEMLRLKRENEELRKENLFLKKAAAFFAKEID